LTRVTAITVGGSATPWQNLGIPTTPVVDGVAYARLGDVALRIAEAQPPGLAQLSVSDCPTTVASLNGLSLAHDDEVVLPEIATAPNSFSIRVSGVDHVVVMADDVRATCAEIERVSGAPLRRVKEGERGVQGFHRWGSVILEVVERRLVDPLSPTGAASYWGFVLVVDNIDETAAHLGPDVISAPKAAVQSGRRIATVRSGAGLGVPLALMSH
jgi:hypothetical protein